MERLNRIATLARKMMLTARQAVALPTAITVASSKVGMSEEAFVSECMANAPLASYVASVCRQSV